MTATLYMDSSALVKLVRDEPESHALRARALGCQLVSSEISHVEAGRALRRHGLSDAIDDMLEPVYLYSLDPMLRRDAARLDPVELRSLDSVHLANALRFGPELDAFVCYDERLNVAAKAAGLPVESPGR